MNWLKNLLGRVYVAYVLLLFIAMMFVLLLPMWLVSFLPTPYDIRCFSALGRAWMKVYMPLVGCFVFVKGKANVKTGGPFVMVCNHNSFADIHTTYYAIPGSFKSLAKKEMAKTPIWGIMYRVGSVLVDRKDPVSRKHAFTEMKEVLQDGINMLLYPEGTRNKTDQPLKEFYDGAFSLAIETQRPILPIIIRHTRKITPPGKGFYAWPHYITLEFLPAIPTDHLTIDDVATLKQEVFQLMWNELEKK
jgi:1-acyl-sn-glycerol-3-phosphate acyltransferase